MFTVRGIRRLLGDLQLYDRTQLTVTYVSQWDGRLASFGNMIFY